MSPGSQSEVLLSALLEECELLFRKGQSPTDRPERLATTRRASELVDELGRERLRWERSPRLKGAPDAAEPASAPPGLRHFRSAAESLREDRFASERFPRLLEETLSLFAWSSFYRRDFWSASFLDEIAALKLLGPAAPAPSERLALGLFLMGPGVHYPLHAHAAEELYLTIGGAIDFRSDPKQPWRTTVPGDLIYHRVHEPHEMRTRERASVALYLWSGEIFEPSWYKGNMETPEEPPKYPEM